MSPTRPRTEPAILRRASLPAQDAVRAARSKVSMTVARLIAADVAERRLAPGSPLPPEHEMAAFFGVGRPSVREALRILEAQGLVTIRAGQGGGPVVRKPTPADYGQAMSLFLQMGGVTYRDALDLHADLAGLTAERAARAVAAGQADELDELVSASRRELADENDDATFVTTGSSFHEILLRMAGNDTLTVLAGGLGYVFAVRAAQVHAGHWEVGERKQVAEEHKALAAAVRAGSATKARRLGEAHVSSQVAALLELSPGLLDEVVDWR